MINGFLLGFSYVFSQIPELFGYLSGLAVIAVICAIPIFVVYCVIFFITKRSEK